MRHVAGAMARRRHEIPAPAGTRHTESTEHMAFRARSSGSKPQLHLIDDPLHPILSECWEYEVVGFSYQRPPDGTEPYVDLTVRRDVETRTLRFWGPREIQLAQLYRLPRIFIHDVSARGFAHLTLRVDDEASGPDAVRFWARAVEELEPSATRA